LKLFSTQQMPEGYEIFQAHNLRAVELIDMDRGDKINPIDFVYVFFNTHFLIGRQSHTCHL